MNVEEGKWFSCDTVTYSELATLVQRSLGTVWAVAEGKDEANMNKEGLGHSCFLTEAQ